MAKTCQTGRIQRFSKGTSVCSEIKTVTFLVALINHGFPTLFVYFFFFGKFSIFPALSASELVIGTLGLHSCFK